MTLLETAHEMAQGLYEAGIINAEEMQEFDRLCYKGVDEAQIMIINNTNE